jgi:hypothetical protein
VSNAPTTVGVYEYWVNFDSAAVVLANDVYIVAHPSSDSVILAQADMTYSVLSNGDDGFALVYGGKPSRFFDTDILTTRHQENHRFK